MRNIEFRGRNVHGVWLYGNLIKINEGEMYIVEPNGCMGMDDVNWNECSVEPESVGQVTDFKDSQNINVVEGDIYENSITHLRYVIEWLQENGAFVAREIGNEQWYFIGKSWFFNKGYVGCAFENKELLKKD